MSKPKPRVDTTQAPAPAKDDKKDAPAPEAAKDEADKNATDGPGEMDVD